MDSLYQLEGLTITSFEPMTIGVYNTKDKALHKQNSIFKSQEFLIPRIHEIFPFKIKGKVYCWRPYQNIVYNFDEAGNLNPLLSESKSLKFHPDNKHGFDGMIASVYRFLDGKEENPFNLTMYPEDSIRFHGFYFNGTTIENTQTSNPDDLEELLFQSLATRPSSFTPLNFNLKVLVITGNYTMLPLVFCTDSQCYPNAYSEADAEWVTELKNRASAFFVDTTEVLLKQAFATADTNIILNVFKSRNKFKKYLESNPSIREVSNPSLSESVRLFSDGNYIFSFIPKSEFQLELYEIKEIKPE